MRVISITHVLEAAQLAANPVGQSLLAAIPAPKAGVFCICAGVLLISFNRFLCSVSFLPCLCPFVASCEVTLGKEGTGSIRLDLSDVARSLPNASALGPR